MGVALSPDPDRPFGLVLSGGGARGAFQVGVWDVLRNDRRGIGDYPLVVSGTSAGAINGSLMAAGLSPQQMLEFWIDLGRHPPVVANARFFRAIERALRQVLIREPLRSFRRRRRAARILAGLIRKHGVHRPSNLIALAIEYVLTARYDNVSDLLSRVNTSHMFTTGPFRERLVQAIGGEAIVSPRIRLAINAVDVHTGHVVRFVNHKPHGHSEMDTGQYHYTPAITADMVLASGSIPLLFNTVVIDGVELWDGGLLVNTPLAPTVSLGARRIIPVLVTSGRAPRPREPMDLGTGIERLADAFLENAYNTDRKLLLERNELARSAPQRGLSAVQLYKPIRPRSSRTFDAGSYLYFSPTALREMYAAGRAAATQWLDRGPLLDTHPGAHV